MFGDEEVARTAEDVCSTSPETPTVRIFVVYARELMRRGLRQLVESTPGLVLVGEAPLQSGSSRRIAQTRTDVVIIDACPPDDDVVDLARGIRLKNRRIRCVLIGCTDREETRRAAAASGADGFLTDDVRARVLLEVIRRVARGQRMTTRPTGDVQPPLTPAAVSAQDPHLTTREKQVLGLIATGLTNREIGGRLGLAEKTVKNYVSALMAKLHVEHRTQAAIYQMRQNANESPRETQPVGNGDLVRRPGASF